MKIIISFLLLSTGLLFGQAYPVTASRIITGNGAPSAAKCSNANAVGMVYIRKDAAAANSSFYSCDNTAAATYAWELLGGGSGSALCILSGTQTTGYVLTATDGSSGCSWQTVGGASVDANTLANAWYIADGGTANAITGTPTTAFPGAYAAGQVVIVKANATNTTATTININSLGVKNVTKNGATALAAGNKVSAQDYVLAYDGTQFQLLNYTVIAADIPNIAESQVTNLVSDLAAKGTGNPGVYTAVSFSATPTFTASSNTDNAWSITLTANVTSSTLASSAAGQILNFKVCQDGTGGRTFAWPTGFSAAAIILPVASACTKQSFFWDGTNAIPVANATADLGPNVFSAEQSAPGTPPSASVYCWFDSTDHSGWECKANGSSSVFKMVLSGVDVNPVTGQVTGLHISSTTCTAPQVLTAISAGGAGTCSPPVLTQNSQSAAYTTVLGDAGKSIYHPGADTTARIWTIDSNANVAYVLGTCITFINDTSAGVITISVTSDTLVLAGAGTTGSRTLAASGIATACKMTTTRWMINGSGLT